MKHYEKIKHKEMVYETNLGFENQLHVGNVLVSHNARPKTVPIISNK